MRVGVGWGGLGWVDLVSLQPHSKSVEVEKGRNRFGVRSCSGLIWAGLMLTYDPIILAPTRKRLRYALLFIEFHLFPFYFSFIFFYILDYQIIVWTISFKYFCMFFIFLYFVL